MSKKGKSQADPKESTKPAPILIDSTLLWKYLSKEDIEKLDKFIPFEIEKYLAEKFNLERYEIDLKQACFVDFYVTQFWWAAKQQKYNHEFISAFFSIIYDLMKNLLELKFSRSDNIIAFEGILMEVNDSRLFPDDTLKEIISHIERTFFHQYKLYQYVVSETQSEIILPKEILIECPMPIEENYPAPLDEAMPDKMYSKYVLKIDDDPKKMKSGTVQEEDEDLNNDLEMNQELIDQIHSKFNNLTVEDARKIILEVTNDLVTDLKSDMKNKIKDREAALLNELEKNAQSKNSRKK